MSNSHHHIPGSVYNLKFRPFGTFILRSPHSTADLAVGERTSDLELRAHLEQLEPVYADAWKAHYQGTLALSGLRRRRTLTVRPGCTHLVLMVFPVAFIPHIGALSPAPAQQLRSSRGRGCDSLPHYAYGLLST